ncbi:MAG: SGNH/GDSL hydrolase family protein [Bryobacteraceae bacterium]|nr:SGNH/GDSL hydrolase family protein [Bryobacteraceae bacterium]
MSMRLVIAFVLCLQAASAGPFTSLYFFGDSLSDTGNVYRATSFLNVITLGLAPVTPESPPYFNGRFSNGPVWAETTASRLGRAGDAQYAGMTLGSFGNFQGPGRNYAIGGARTGTGGALGSFDSLVPTGVQAQVTTYLNRNGGAADPNALYFLLGGGNDLRDLALITDLQTQANQAGAAALDLTVSFIGLYQAGARNFAMINGPNIGLIPESLAAGRGESGFYASLFFNAYLDYYGTVLQSLPGMNLITFDLFSLYNDVILDTLQGGSRYGFTSLQPCIGGAVSCQDSLFFDDIHPTARLHSLFGNAIADQILSDPLVVARQEAMMENPEPATVAMFAGGIGLIVLVRRRQAQRK